MSNFTFIVDPTTDAINVGLVAIVGPTTIGVATSDGTSVGPCKVGVFCKVSMGEGTVYVPYPLYLSESNTIATLPEGLYGVTKSFTNKAVGVFKSTGA